MFAFRRIFPKDAAASDSEDGQAEFWAKEAKQAICTLEL
jgi:hypothetical protein